MKIDYDLNWGSHLPVLMKVMGISSGSVLEMGAGLYSTPFLYWMCKDQKRRFTSYENNFDWWKMVWNIHDIKKEPIINKGIDRLTSANYVSNWDDADIERPWGIVLIDHSPSRRRIIDIKRVAKLADYVVVHDTQRNFKFCNISDINALFKYRYDYKKAIPWTTVFSNYFNLRKVLK